MRILMLNNEYPPLGGGTGTVNEAILKEFSEYADLDIDLVTSAAGKEFEMGLLFDRFRIFRLPVDRFNIHHASNGELLRYAWRSFWFSLRLHQREPYDLCMAWSTVPAGGAALALRVAAGLPYIVRVTGPDIPGFEARYDRVTALLKPVIRRIWRGAQVVVAKCREEVDMIRAVEPGLPVETIPNGVDVDRFRVERPPYEGPLRILCVGRLIARKGQADLIEAVRRLTVEGYDVRCRLVGTGDMEAAYRRQVQEAGLEGIVEFSGYVPRERMPEVYAEADVFVLPSYAEGMSVAALEALAAQIPIILTRVGGAEQIIDTHFNRWLIEPGRVNDIFEIIREMVISTKLLTSMIAACVSLSKVPTWNNVAASYKQIFDSGKYEG